ncbi:short chain dehydrogenase reductase [Grosmannia clavigera kw1407]|uniref:Short chain dehydrogenase reductase n=1 Tax=Grosmannia clavigera (strain kw1407 / UAMH 11150) TaxID=655863 RepID=F0XE63_GROCL|nr:short chain dehydrogenase reductase [Grosmannia clavigera kw1407]EFX04133.1 short chain dehydrogenase reductase [Grosmannia clavigera kw1407]
MTLITGCSSGLGLALTREVLARGHHVIATLRNPEKTADLDEGIVIDVLVNNSGFAVLQTIEQVTEAEVRAETETLYFGPLRLVQAILPQMRRQRFGVIIYISSGAGLEARPSMGIYGAAKAAGDAMTKTLAKEVAPFNVRALYVSLGGFRTNMGNSTHTGSQPLEGDYAGGEADQTIRFMASGAFQGRGDPTKVAKAIFDVATAQGVGRGHENATLLPLGSDVDVRIGEVRKKLDDALTVFGDVCNSVQVDD